MAARGITRILVFEPDQSIRRVLVHLFQGTGFAVVECGHPSDAFRAAQCDIALVEIRSRDFDSADVGRMLLARQKAQQVLFFSGDRIGSAVDACVEMLADVKGMLERADP
jgi:DNA-binding response OmpR family regulator